MRTFFAVLALDQFGELRRQTGYSRAVALLDELRDAVAAHLPTARSVRANRETIEFLFDSETEPAAAELLRNLQQNLGRTIHLRGEDLACTVTIAALPCRRGSVSESQVVEAEEALARAMHEGRKVDLAGQSSGPDEQQIADDMRAALRDGGFTLHYQPKLRARSGEIAGAEALLRWNHPVRGPVRPDEFIPIAERYRDIGALTCWVVDQALADQQRLRELDVDISIHVNLSAQLVADTRFVADLLARLGPAAGTMGLEITETAMIADPEGALANLKMLADAGVHLSIDDYGAGFSSLAYLQRLPVKELKIDKSFVSRLSTGPRDPLLVRSTIDLAHALEMEVTAEGVETPAELALLQVMRCDLLQGFLLSRPVPFEQLIDFALQNRAGPALPRPMSLAERARLRRGEEGANAA